jgi:hypothetical protein
MMDDTEQLANVFEGADERLGVLEARLREGPPQLEPMLEESSAVVAALLVGYGRHAGKDMPPGDGSELLELFKAFVKGDPSLNAVRDNVRELVYYRNCLAMDRSDALPPASEKMAVRTARHIYLYLRSRSEQEGRLER